MVRTEKLKEKKFTLKMIENKSFKPFIESKNIVKS